MVNTKIISSNGFYIFESKVCANNNYIESLSESKILLSYLNYYLKGYLKIYDYIITKHGFLLVVKLKEEPIIRKIIQGKKRNKTKLPLWKIISERIRLCLSTYVKRVNKSRGRTGVLVHSSYLKFHFKNLEDAKRHIEGMRKQLIKFYQRKKSFRTSKKQHIVSPKIAKGSIFLCIKEILIEKRKRKKDNENQVGFGLRDFVVGEFVKFKLLEKNPSKYPTKPNSSA